MADKKTRAALEDLFSSGKIPSQDNFAELIASGINQTDDGLQKAGDTGLKIQAPPKKVAAGEAKEFILLYEDFKQDQPNWGIRSRTGGLELGRGAGPDFLIDKDGKVGIGTDKPLRSLEVNNAMRFTNSAADKNDGVIGSGTFGAGLNIVGIKTDNTFRKLSIWGEITQKQNNGTNSWSGKSSFAGEVSIGSIKLSGFTNNDTDEWPNFTWLRDTAAKWDEGLIKHRSIRGVFKRAGFGVHMHQDREFGLWSSNWTPLFAIKGGSGDGYFRGNVGIGTVKPLGPLSIGDSSVNGSDGYLVIGKKAGSSTRHFRIGFNRDFYFTIGDYGNNNNAAAWKSPFSIGYDAPNNALVISRNGNIGIGTPKPLQKLHIHNSYLLNTKTANNTNAKAFLSKPAIPNHSVLMAGAWKDHLYFYFKSEGKVYRVAIKGTPL